MGKLFNFIEKLLTAVLGWLFIYKKGQDDAHHEQTQKENEALKAGLNAALHGDYSADTVRKRMQNNNLAD